MSNIIEEYGLAGILDGRPLPVGNGLTVPVLTIAQANRWLPEARRVWDFERRHQRAANALMVAAQAVDKDPADEDLAAALDLANEDADKASDAWQKSMETALDAYLTIVGADWKVAEKLTPAQLLEAFKDLYQLVDPRRASGLLSICSMAAARRASVGTPKP